MSGATSIAGAGLATVAPTPEDGVVVGATEHLEPVKYPNRLDDIAVVGRTGAWRRTFMLRPKYGGRFLFLLYPRQGASSEDVLSEPVHFPNFNSAPKVLELRIPPAQRIHHEWDWRLVKTTFVDTEEGDFELRETVKRPGDGFLDGRPAASLTSAAEADGSISHLIFGTRPALEGRIRFSEELDRGVSRMIAWSCHQPYETQNGNPGIHRNSKDILKWLNVFADKFDPHRVWALGDTCYSDGIGPLNFVKQVYDKTGWHNNWDLRKDLLSLFRLCYRHHWSFPAIQGLMRNYPHIAMWDDHEIRDGYGSESADFAEENKAMKDIASQAAEEYLFSWNTRARSESGKNVTIDNHLAYVDAPVAAFVFDGRNNRRYGEDIPLPPDIPLFASIILGAVGGAVTGGLLGGIAGAAAGLAAGTATSTAATVAVEKELIELYRWHNPGEVISEQQLADFSRYCDHIRGLPGVRYLLLGNSVPFIYVNDIIEALAAELELTATELGQHIRDDIRDSWHSPGNRRQLSRLIGILRNLHIDRPDIEIINLSGDIHISNAFTARPDGFSKPIYQVTSSALTNRISISDSVSNLLSVGGTLNFLETDGDFGEVRRLWHEGVYQNFLSIEARETAITLHLHAYNRDDEQAFGTRDRKLIIRPGAGYELREA